MAGTLSPLSIIVEKIITQQQFYSADYLWTAADSSDRKTTLTITHTKRTETARCCIPRVNTPFMTWIFDRFRSGNHATNCGRHDDHTSDGDRLVAETLAKFFWWLNDFSVLASALASCVLFRDEYRSSITDKTRRPIARLFLLSNFKLFECRRD